MREPEATGGGASGGGGGPERRAASVTLRQGGVAPPDGAPRHDHGGGDLLDPANQSLADALRITLRLVQAGMLVIAGLYFLSGFQSVKENERATRLVFGRPDLDDIRPGFRFSYPYPVGELVKVDTGQIEVKLQDEFWIHLDEKSKDKPVSELPTGSQLTPGMDGANLTADGNIAHTRWKVLYVRAKPSEYARRVLPRDEERLVRAAVQRGVVQACAQVTIDDLLKQSADDQGSVVGKARAVAQGMLDNLGTGLVINRLLLENKIPPMRVRESFNNVQASVSQAQSEREKAQAQARQTLNSMAGDAVPTLIDLINRYELAQEKGDRSEQDSLRGQINALLEGDAGSTISGEVAKIISDARQYRSEIVSKRRAELAIFEAKLAQYKANPKVMLNREWAQGLTAFLSRDNVELFVLPGGVNKNVVMLNRDPDIVKAIETAQRESQNEQARKRREEELRRESYRPATGMNTRTD